jgi:hypothetical protein
MAAVGIIAVVLYLGTAQGDKQKRVSVYQPPNVDGEVSGVDALTRRIELTIGSDDGLVNGHVLYVFRTKPVMLLVGKIRIVSTENDTAIGEMIDTTSSTVSVQEGDHVSFREPAAFK